MYQKEIIYIGLYKNGDRVGSAGFLKAERRERESRLYLKVQNIPLGISGRFPVRVYNGSDWKEINGLIIRDGGGIWQENLEERSDKTMIQVMLSGGYMLEGKGKSVSETFNRRNEADALQKRTQTNEDITEQTRLNEDTPEQTRLNEDIPEQTKQSEDMPGRIKLSKDMPERTEQSRDVSERTEQSKDVSERTEQSREVSERIEQSRDVPGRTEQSENISEPTRQNKNMSERNRIKNEPVIVTEELSRSALADVKPTPQGMTVYKLKEDKWEQILDTYENVHPYGDERVYVKLEPKDFVILQSKYQHLVNNSFLLHGFYNYRYIILGKETGYYLGVPGVFYEREKMVAQMFGFEAFECPGGNVRAGEFGYYLRKVEI